MIEERIIPNDRIEVLPCGDIQVREATVIVRDGEIDASFAPKYHRYTLTPGDDLTGKNPRIVAVAQSVWTEEIIAAARERASEPDAVPG